MARAGAPDRAKPAVREKPAGIGHIAHGLRTRREGHGRAAGWHGRRNVSAQR
jgi:hypothetical protein